MKRLGYLSLVLLLLGWLPAAPPENSAPVRIAEAQQASAAPQTVTVLVGGGQDTIVLDGFFPQKLRIRVGDTVTWKFDGEPTHRHTVTLVGGPFPGPKDAAAGGGPGEVMPGRWVPVPGGAPGDLMRNPVFAAPTRQAGAPVETYDGGTYINSGEMSTRPRLADMPKNDTFSVTFTQPGTYRYFCLFHRPHMVGTIEVAPASAADIPDQAEIDRRARAEMDHLMAMIAMAKEQTNAVRSQPGPKGSTLWFVRAGAYELDSGEHLGLSFDFLPKDLTIKAGDTVIWEAVDAHTITFIPAPPAPEIFIIKPQADAYPQLIRNPKVFRSAKPAAVYDQAQHFNSGPIGQTTRNGTSWALTFDTPGVYEYICALHHEMGMKGTIIVQQQEARSP
jgi:plastocyanin